MNPQESNSIERSNKGDLRVLLVLFLIGVSLCIQDTNYEKPETDVIQPELSEEEFIELVNNILVEKVSLRMFDFFKGQYTYRRNTLDYNGEKINITVRRYGTEINITVDDGHFRENPSAPPPVRDTFNPQMIDVRGLFTPQIESQVDLTPPSKFNKKRTDNISVMGYNGTFKIWRTRANIHFRNIGELTPSPTHPDPTGTAIYYVYAGFIALILGIVVLVIYIIKKWRKS